MAIEREGELYLDKFEVAKKYGLKEWQLSWLRKSGQLNSYRIPLNKRTQWRASEIEAVLNANPEPTNEPHPKNEAAPGLQANAAAI